MSALGLGVFEKFALEKQWTYLNRLYPEPTELQKTLYREAMLYKEIDYQEKDQKDKLRIDPTTKQIYTQMYQLPPQRYPDPDDNPNPPTIKTHY